MRIMCPVRSLFLSAALLLSSVIPTYAAASKTSLPKSPVLLQINEYNFLYTYPKAPYLDQNQRLIIPLRAISELLGASVSYNAALKQATIKMNGKVLQVTANSEQIMVNGTPATLDTTPVTYQQSLLIPIRPLIDSMGLEARQNPTTKAIEIKSDSFDNSKLISAMKEFDQHPELANLSAIFPLYYELSMNTPGKKELLNGQLSITSKNISGEPILQGKEDLHVIFFYDTAIQMEADQSTTDQNNERPRPHLDKDQIFERKLSFSAGNYRERLRYILSVGRTFK